MFSFKVAGKEYKVKFGYRVLCKSDIIDRFVGIQSNMDDSHAFRDMMEIVSEMLLAGLQKYHSDEFGWQTESEREEMIGKVLDLMDDYEDESTEEEPKDGYTLFENLQKELLNNGFLSRINQGAESTAESLDATVIPQDHKKKAKN